MKQLEMVDTSVVETLRAANLKINTDPDGLDFNHRWKLMIYRIDKIVQHRISIGIMAVFTLYALYSDDLRLVLTQSQEADDGFEAAITVTFFMFFIEIVLTSVSKDGYFLWPAPLTRMEHESLFESIWRRIQIGSFYFWLDVVATITLILEMPWLTGDVNNAGGTAQQAGAAARVAARAGRVVRLTRLLKYVKLDVYKDAVIDFFLRKVCMIPHGDDEKKRQEFEPIPESAKDDYDASDKKKSKKDNEKRIEEYAEEDGTGIVDEESKEEPGKDVDFAKKDMEDDIDSDVDEDMNMPESVVGATMTDLTNKRVITLVLAMLICIPLLSVSSTDMSVEVIGSMIHSAGYIGYAESPTPNEVVVSNINSIIKSHYSAFFLSNIAAEKDKAPIISVAFSPVIPYIVQSTGSIENYSGYTNAAYVDSYTRTSEKVEYVGKVGGFTTTVVFDNRTATLTQALQSLYTTSFVISLLFLGTFFFSRTVNHLVIDPIETMVALVTKIQENPLGVDYNKELGEKDGFFEGMETTILLNTINKIGGLMKVGFGEAGASVIAENLKGGGGDGGLNLMSGGRMIHSIFGFCDVRQFTDTTECLQEEVMLFVNRIAHILHSIVVQCSGAANKNIGDAFLLTWKLEDDMTNEEMSSLADQALVTFCKALVELSSYQDFICNFTDAANERLYKRFPGYLVRIGSGLHVGWAIEGAIGSNRKIDASYLSPHVNFTEFLESSTKEYGVPLLISEPFFGLLSPASAKYVRKVDRIRKPGEDAISLYTYDSDLALDWAMMRKLSKKKEKHNVDVHDDHHKTNPKSHRRQSMHAMKADIKTGKHQDEKADKEETERLLEEGQEENHEVAPTIIIPKYKQSFWERDKELIKLRHMVYTNPGYRPLWDTGIDAYLSGDWPTAEHIFKETLTMSKDKCGPSKFLLKVIAERGGFAPPSWPGYRHAN